LNKIDYIKEKFGDFYSHPVDKGSQGILEGTKYAGCQTNLRSKCFTLARMLRPKNCLEIGSWHYISANALGDGMEAAGENNGGVVNSLEIRQGGYDGAAGVRPKNRRVRPLFWLPHHTGQDTWKYDKDIPHPEFKSMTNDEIFEKNLAYLLSVTPADKYDLILIDGDHSYEGISWDWKYVMHVSHDETVIIIDDIWDSRLTPCRQFFDELQTNKWDFESWNDAHRDQVQNSGVTLKY
jgi:hypothetical protein